MGRRRASAPSALVLQPVTVPLIRGAPKFVLPSPPSENAIHLAVHHRLTRTSDATRVGPLKEMPRLEYPVGVYGFGIQPLVHVNPPPFLRAFSTPFVESSKTEVPWIRNSSPSGASDRRSSSISSHSSTDSF